MTHWEMKALEEKLQEKFGGRMSVKAYNLPYRFRVSDLNGVSGEDTSNKMAEVARWLKGQGFKIRMAGGTHATVRVY